MKRNMWSTLAVSSLLRTLPTKNTIPPRFTTTILVLFCCLFVFSGAMEAQNYVEWKAGGAYDQSADKGGEQHSGLVAWSPTAPILYVTVKDTDFANDFAKLIQDKKISFVWVFTQCFGGGMFDELDALGGVQSGVSASNYDKKAYYQAVRPLGNGVSFSTAYIEGINNGNSVAKTMAGVGSDNDPWGPAAAPDPKRTTTEIAGSEQPVYFTTGAAANALDIKDHKDDGAVILWAGLPKVVLDDAEIRQLLLKFVDLGYKKTNIYVLYGKGEIDDAKKHLVGEVLNKNLMGNQLRAATERQLKKVETAIELDDSVKFVFFFANDHGWNDQGGGSARIGGDLYPNDFPQYSPEAPIKIGQGDN